MTESESVALPLGDAAIFGFFGNSLYYIIFLSFVKDFFALFCTGTPPPHGACFEMAFSITFRGHRQRDV